MIIKLSSKYRAWYKDLENKRTKALITTRLDRIQHGNFGDCKSLGNKLHELRLHTGPGYRIYFCHEGPDIIVLYGGTKKNQTTSIKHALVIRKEMI